jgi:branched-chain amino acid transport system permease protein
MLGLSGLLLGAVIVVVMAFLPKGMMENREVEDFLPTERH